jgi:hypothetical protein
MNFSNLLEGQMLLFFLSPSSHKIKKLHLTKPHPDVKKNCLISELDLAFFRMKSCILLLSFSSSSSNALEEHPFEESPRPTFTFLNGRNKKQLIIIIIIIHLYKKKSTLPTKIKHKKELAGSPVKRT